MTDYALIPTRLIQQMRDLLHPDFPAPRRGPKRALALIQEAISYADDGASVSPDAKLVEWAWDIRNMLTTDKSNDWSEELARFDSIVDRKTIYVIEGDDHEARITEADSEGEAMEAVLSDFREQYGDYDADQLVLLGSYPTIHDAQVAHPNAEEM